jgi:predicted AlkP superfamily phosphohydrolase/phosphomutase
LYLSLAYGILGSVGGLLGGGALASVIRFGRWEILKSKLLVLYFIYFLTFIVLLHISLRLTDLHIGIYLTDLFGQNQIKLKRIGQLSIVLISAMVFAIMWGYVIIKITVTFVSSAKPLITWKRVNFTWFGLSVVTVAGLIFTNSVASVPEIATHQNVRPVIKKDKSYSINSKVILIGLDGATWSVMNPMILKGQLPNFSKLVKSGAVGSLETILPTFSPIIWTSIATGKTAPKHGVVDVILADLPGMSPLPLEHGLNPPSHFGTPLVFYALYNSPFSKKIPFTSNQRKAKTLWNILSEYHLTVQIVNWFVSWPAEEINGVMVSDYLTFSSWENELGIDLNTSLTYPPELIEKISPYIRFPASLTLPEVKEFMNISESDLADLLSRDFHITDKLAQFRTSYLSDQSYAGINLYLTKTHPADFTAIYLNGLDPVEHFFWHYQEPQFFGPMPKQEMAKYGHTIENYYRFLDKKVGQFIEALGEEATIIIVSDHGMIATGELPWSGQHVDTAPPGIIIMNGPQIKKGIWLTKATIFDIAPTILFLMGFPVGEDMDGSVLFDAIDPNFSKMYPIRYITSYDYDYDYSFNPQESDIDEVLKQKFKSLGYLN